MSSSPTPHDVHVEAVPLGTGRPDAAGAQPDLRAAFDWLMKRGCIGVVWGEGEGGGGEASAIRPETPTLEVGFGPPLEQSQSVLRLLLSKAGEPDAGARRALIDAVAGVRSPDSDPSPAPSSSRIERDELWRFVHDVRNMINSMVMNAGVVAAAARSQPGIEPFVRQIEASGVACAARLRAFSDRHL